MLTDMAELKMKKYMEVEIFISLYRYHTDNFFNNRILFQTAKRWRVPYLHLRLRDKDPSSLVTSVADPGCLSHIPDLGSRIPQQQQKRRRKKLVVFNYFLSTSFTKLRIILFSNRYRKKI
jgi:hypothetical protein